jgi:NAD(P)-dependent dehydrogenase (short-subunit alcohol dehydrogenase family)
VKALVTGASRGIGRAIANLLLEHDAEVALAVRDPNSVAELVASHPRAIALQVDLSRPEQTEALIDRASTALSGLDVLVNCAGIVRYRSIAELTRAELLEQMELNLYAPLELARRAALHMRAAGLGGTIVNVASTLGIRPVPLTAAYAASKAALISVTRSLALEFGPDHVRVNALAPGVVDTEMVRVVRTPPSSTAVPRAHAEAVEAELAALRALHPLGSLGTPREIAEAALYLIQAQFVSGTVLVVDGGLLLGS